MNKKHYFAVPKEHLIQKPAQSGQADSIYGTRGVYGLSDEIVDWFTSRGYNYDFGLSQNSGYVIIINDDNIALEFMLTWA